MTAFNYFYRVKLRCGWEAWDIPYFEQEKPEFEWSIFAPPPPSGQPGYLNFHLDVGMGLNAASRHKKEAIEFLMPKLF